MKKCDREALRKSRHEENRHNRQRNAIMCVKLWPSAVEMAEPEIVKPAPRQPSMVASFVEAFEWVGRLFAWR